MNKVKLDMGPGLQLFQVILGFMNEQETTKDLTLEIQVAGPFVRLCDVKTEKVLILEFDNYGGSIASSVKDKDSELLPGPDFEINKESELKEYIQTVFGM